MGCQHVAVALAVQGARVKTLAWTLTLFGGLSDHLDLFIIFVKHVAADEARLSHLRGHLLFEEVPFNDNLGDNRLSVLHLQFAS